MTGASRSVKRILVTGVTGFLGRYVLSELLADGWEVVALVRNLNLHPSIRRLDVHWILGDLADPDGWFLALPNVEAICHMAAYVPSDYSDPKEAEKCLAINSLATLLLAQLALAKPKCQFVYISTGNLYSQGDGLADEESAAFPADYATYYLASKLAGDLYVEHLRRVKGLSSIVLRPTAIYGHGMREKSVVSKFIDRAVRGEPLVIFDGGVARFDWVYAEDVARAVTASLRGCESGIYNIGGYSHTVLELAREVATIFSDKRVTVDVRPASERTFLGFRPVSNIRAVRSWGYSPLTLKEGLTRYRQAMEDSDYALGHFQ